MARSDTYNTKQKEYILNIIKNKQKDFTIKELYEDIKGKVGQTTIYRLIDKLVKEGNISKTIDNNNITYYHYLEKCNEENHFYLKCDECGSMEHIDCDCITTLSNHILKHHKFITNKEHIIINGICKNCIRS